MWWFVKSPALFIYPAVKFLPILLDVTEEDIFYFPEGGELGILMH